MPPASSSADWPRAEAGQAACVRAVGLAAPERRTAPGWLPRPRPRWRSRHLPPRDAARTFPRERTRLASRGRRPLPPPRWRCGRWDAPAFRLPRVGRPHPPGRRRPRARPPDTDRRPFPCPARRPARFPRWSRARRPSAGRRSGPGHPRRPWRPRPDPPGSARRRALPPARAAATAPTSGIRRPRTTTMPSSSTQVCSITRTRAGAGPPPPRLRGRPAARCGPPARRGPRCLPGRRRAAPARCRAWPRA